MADNKKYYYLKIKENFYDSEEMIILQSMQDGYLYSDILMKLYLRSLKNNGKLMFKDVIPYTPSILSTVVRHQVGTVEKALKIFRDLGLIDILDNGAIYMLDIQNFIGKSSTEADRKREYRGKIDVEKNTMGHLSTNCPDKSTPEIEKEIELEKEKELSTAETADEPECNVFIKIILNDKTYYPISNDLLNQYKELYPAVDVEQELRKFAAWSLSNPTKRKTKRGILRSINNWLSSEQDKGCKKATQMKEPDWFYKRNEKNDVSKEEEKEMSDFLDNF